MVVNNNGDLELYAIHDTPKQAPWSSRGDLAIGAGQTYKIISGFHDSEPAPWDIPANPNARPPESISQPREESVVRGRPKHHPTFGRGDEDGFPALSSTIAKEPPSVSTTKSTKSKTRSPAPFRKYHFEHSSERLIVDGDSPLRESPVDQLAETRGESTSQGRHKSQRDKSMSSRGRRHPTRIIQQVVENDISMIMRTRAIRGYGLSNVQSHLLSTRIKILTSDYSLHTMSM